MNESTHPIPRSEAVRRLLARLEEVRPQWATWGDGNPVLYVSIVPLHPGEVRSGIADDPIGQEPHSQGSWVGYLDLVPLANYAHPVEFLFLDPDGALRVQAHTWFPRSWHWAFFQESESRLRIADPTSVRRYTVDAAITIAREEIVLVRRGQSPFEGTLVLPGGHLEPTDPDKESGCARELAEEVGLTVKPAALEHLIRLARPGRDPRPGHEETTVFTLDLPDRMALGGCKAGSDARAIEILRIADLREDEIGFDHFDAIKALRERRGY